MINYILFDVDNTLYPASSGIGLKMIRRMNIFVSGLLNVSVTEAAEMRRDRDPSLYDSTLSWLMKEYRFTDTESFFSTIHPCDFENYFPKNLLLSEMMENLPIPCSILTNSSEEHAINVTDYLEITPYFENIFDLKFNNFNGKPDKYAFQNVLDFIGKTAENVLFIDDIPRSLESFKNMGGNVLLVDERSEFSGSGLPSVEKITDLTLYLKKSGIV